MKHLHKVIGEECSRDKRVLAPACRDETVCETTGLGAGVWGPARRWTVEATFWAREGLKERYWGGEQRVYKLLQSKCSLLKRNLRVSEHLREFKGTSILFLKCYYIKGKYTHFSFLFYFFFLKFNSVISQISPASSSSNRKEPMCTQTYFTWGYLISLHHATSGVP